MQTLKLYRLEPNCLACAIVETKLKAWQVDYELIDGVHPTYEVAPMLTYGEVFDLTLDVERFLMKLWNMGAKHIFTNHKLIPALQQFVERSNYGN